MFDHKSFFSFFRSYCTKLKAIMQAEFFYIHFSSFYLSGDKRTAPAALVPAALIFIYYALSAIHTTATIPKIISIGIARNISPPRKRNTIIAGTKIAVKSIFVMPQAARRLNVKSLKATHIRDTKNKKANI